MFRFTILLGLVLSLTACGFQLRGSEAARQQAAFALKELNVQARDQYGATLRDLRELLQNSGVEVRPGAPFTLYLADEQYDRRAVTYTTSGRTAEYELKQTLDYEIRGRNNLLLQADSLEVQKVYMHDSSNLISGNQEETLLKVEMRREMIQRLVAQLQRITPEELNKLQVNAEAEAKARQEALDAQRRASEQNVMPPQLPEELFEELP